METIELCGTWKERDRAGMEGMCGDRRAGEERRGRGVDIIQCNVCFKIKSCRGIENVSAVGP